jgi:hypothetical protein
MSRRATLYCRCEFWLCQAGAFLLLNVIEDPAWLALMFC